MRTLGALLGLTVLLLPAMAAAQDFPNKPIRLIVPFPAGGPNDIIARVVGQRMSELMKQPVVIENRSGQGGALGTDTVAKAKPDGYTIAILQRGGACHQPQHGKSRLRHAEGFTADHAGGHGAGDAGGRHQRPRRRHEGTGRTGQGASPGNSILHRPAPAACRIWPANC